MKKSLVSLGVMVLVATAMSCGNAETDAKKQAEQANDAKIDSAKTADTVAAATSHTADLKPDADFAVAAADGGMLEVELGKLAAQKGVSSDVKKLGAMMVKDHSKANDELKAAAKAKDITLPATMSDKCQKTLSDLTQKQGADFDKAYADLMVSDHKDDIDEFKKEAEKGNDKDLSAWAKGKVPVLQHHLMVAEQTKKAVDKK